jgi:hypothetical protein
MHYQLATHCVYAQTENKQVPLRPGFRSTLGQVSFVKAFRARSKLTTEGAGEDPSLALFACTTDGRGL